MVTTPERIRPVRIEEEMRSSYLSYAMSVIVARALPDVRDGLKPVQRRILYAMHELGLRPNSAYKKSARIVGEVMGKYHPHGDAPIYDAMVRMAQDFSMRYPLVDGQGNFGSVDDDPPAAMRYTEARLAAIAEEMLADIDLNTVDMTLNFDESLQEPTVLPARLPNMLVNGASGIAVGMATSIPPHNLGEICDAACHLIDHPDAYVDDLLQIVPGPDFPTAAIVLIGKEKDFVRQIYSTGHGRVVMRARTEVEELRGGRRHILITELPYQVNKASLVERIAQLARDRKIDGISDIRDESDREGLRVVVELKRDAQEDMVLNNLFKHTAMQSSFNVTMLALVDGQPQVLGLKRALQLYIDHRHLVITRRSQLLLKRAQERAHIVEGLRLALANLDLVIRIIRGSQDAESARANLMRGLNLTEVQAQAILDMPLRRLAALEQQKLEDEYQALQKTINELQELLADPAKILATVREETVQLKKRYASARRTEVVEEEPGQHSREEYVQHQDVVVTLSRRGYIKCIPSATYKQQQRGGKGVKGMSTREDDELQELLVADTHDMLLLFTNRGRVYSLRCFELPTDASRTSRGVPLVRLIPIPEGERVSTLVAVPPGLKADDYLVMATRAGEVKAMSLSLLANVRSSGIHAMKLDKGDELIKVARTNGATDVVMVSERGQAIRFPVSVLTPHSRLAGGVRGMRLAPGDKVVSVSMGTGEGYLLVASEGGYGKCTPLSKYRGQSRGGVGIRTLRVTDKTGSVAAAYLVSEMVQQEILLISAMAQVIRISLEDVKIGGRNTQGVIVWRDRDPEDRVVSIACFKNNHQDKP